MSETPKAPCPGCGHNPHQAGYCGEHCDCICDWEPAPPQPAAPTAREWLRANLQLHPSSDETTIVWERTFDRDGREVWPCKDGRKLLLSELLTAYALSCTESAEQAIIERNIMYEGMLERAEAALAAKERELAEARPVVERCAAKFREYEAIHAAKPDEQKAAANREMAEMCEAWLSRQSQQEKTP